MILNPIKAKLIEVGQCKWPQIAVAADVPYGTIVKIARGYTRNPGVLAVEALADYFGVKVTMPKRIRR